MADPRWRRRVERRTGELRRAIGSEVRRLREDANVSRADLAAAIGMDRSAVRRIETGEREASLATLVAIAEALGCDLGVRLHPTTGPRLRDRFQAPMVEALLRTLHARWTPAPETVVHRPARGVVDVALHDPVARLLVATEAQSEIRRLEQQLRWHREKAESLPSSDIWQYVAADAPPAISRLLVLRSTQTLRELARAYEATLRAAYPARAGDAVAALTGTAPWPGPAIVWVVVEGGVGRLLDGPPRGVRLGR